MISSRFLLKKWFVNNLFKINIENVFWGTYIYICNNIKYLLYILTFKTYIELINVVLY